MNRFGKGMIFGDYFGRKGETWHYSNRHTFPKLAAVESFFSSEACVFNPGFTRVEIPWEIPAVVSSESASAAEAAPMRPHPNPRTLPNMTIKN